VSVHSGELPGDIDSMHPLLRRQLRRLGLGVDLPDLDQDTWISLLHLVHLTYGEADEARELHDHAYDVASREMQDLYEELRLSSESALALQRDRLQAVFDSVGTGLIILDAEGDVLLLNPAAELLLGTTTADVRRLALQALLRAPASDISSTRCLTTLEAAVTALLPWRGDDLSLTTLSGRTFPGALTYTPLVTDGRSGGGVLAITDMTERKRAEAELAWRATHDVLTGLLNRATLHERVEDALVRSRRSSTLCATLFVDLDRFKLVNDTLGHAVGDRLLIAAAERIRGVVRELDTLARLGGDEFVVLCEGLDDPLEAVSVAERIVETLNQPFQLGSESAFVSASVGIAIDAGDATPSSLLRDSDVALYRAKDAGRERAVVFDESMRDAVAERVLMDRQLRNAVDNDELQLVFQPLFDLHSGRLSGFEALLRWDGPNGQVPPDVFIPVAEETGLINTIGDWVLNQGTAFLAELTLHGDSESSLSLNVSAVQLSSFDLTTKVVSALERSQVPASRLTLELTETALLGDPDLAAQRLKQLKAQGVRLALDDFGTGFSSLSSLRRFPFDALKIDRTFVAELSKSTDHAIIDAIIALGHAMSMTITAEGIETIEQHQLLRDLGCDLGQGFQLGRPMPYYQALALAMSWADVDQRLVVAD